MTPRQLVTWIAYEDVEPFGQKRADYHAAQIMAMVHNVAVDEKKQRAVESFLLKFEEKKPRRKQTVEEQIAMATLIVAAFNGPGKNS